MNWRVAKSLDHLLGQVNAKYPNRDKESDGAIGDLRHQNEKTSDHNPWVHDGAMGVVTARDITHDPAHGFDSYAFADMLLRNKDSRIKYVISNRRIGSGATGPSPWVWRKYSGTNAHDHHVHISVLADKPHYDSVVDWKLSDLPPAVGQPTPTNPPVKRATLQVYSIGPDVKFLQTKLGLAPDGIFGHLTLKAVLKIQNQRRITADGIVGPQTWAIINE